MITTHKNNLIARCKDRGYTLEEVMSCVISQNGDMWTIDEQHKDYPLKSKKKESSIDDSGYGAGTELKKLLSYIGINSTSNCSCNKRAKIMNIKGIQWCKDNKEEILSWMQEEAQRRGLPFFKFGAKRLLNMAISKAEKKET